MSDDLGIRCPECGAKVEVELCDVGEELVTYWGEDGPVSVDCGRCEHTMLVKETVSRTWSLAEGEVP